MFIITEYAALTHVLLNKFFFPASSFAWFQLKQWILLPNLLYAELLSFFDCLATFPSLPVLSGFMELFTREDNFNCFPDTWYDDQLYTDDVKRIT